MVGAGWGEGSCGEGAWEGAWAGAFLFLEGAADAAAAVEALVATVEFEAGKDGGGGAGGAGAAVELAGPAYTAAVLTAADAAAELLADDPAWLAAACRADARVTLGDMSK